VLGLEEVEQLVDLEQGGARDADAVAVLDEEAALAQGRKRAANCSCGSRQTFREGRGAHAAEL